MSEASDELPIVEGFRFGGVEAGLKARGGLDLALLVAERPVPAAAVFTTNRVRAAPVVVAEKRARGGKARAILVNAGNANACTGAPGLAAARSTTSRLAELLGAKRSHVLPASTGVIGRLLPAERVEAALPQLLADVSPGGTDRFARAIMTTDRWPKLASTHASVGGSGRATVLGIAKGAGMIHPSLATTLAFVVTDAKVSSATLAWALRRAVRGTFDAITVDGETSTNDAIFALASGRHDAPKVRPGGKAARALAAAFADVLGELARSIVRDGEGARVVVRLAVEGARSDREAKRVAERVARSLLVKTAIHGRDPNWGRILSAAGCAGVDFDPAEAELRIGDVIVMQGGQGVEGSEPYAAQAMQAEDLPIHLRIGSGQGRAVFLFCDLGHDYVTVNADYRT